MCPIIACALGSPDLDRLYFQADINARVNPCQVGPDGPELLPGVPATSAILLMENVIGLSDRMGSYGIIRPTHGNVEPRD